MNTTAANLNIGNTAFMLICASLVMLMTPGLAFFYGGLVGRKNGVHGVGGFLGIVLLGLFASRAWNPNGADRLLLGGASFFAKQCAAAILAAGWAFGFTYAMLWLINHVTIARVDAKAQMLGLDAELHGEEAYPQGL